MEQLRQAAGNGPQARKLLAFYQARGRTVAQLGSVRSNAIVESLQPFRSPHRYPRWKTIPADLVLFGAPQENILLFDQVRGEIFPSDFAVPQNGEAEVIYTRSPFVGEYDVVNVLASDNAGIAAAVESIITGAQR